MPTSAPVVCHCGGIKRGGKCERCGTSRSTDYDNSPDGKERNKFYTSSEWRKFRERMKQTTDGLCVECKRNGKITPGTRLDHIKRRRTLPRHRWCHPEEVQWLCESHHNSKTARGG